MLDKEILSQQGKVTKEALQMSWKEDEVSKKVLENAYTRECSKEQGFWNKNSV